MENNSTILKPYQRLMRLFNVDRKDITHIYFYSIFVGLTNLTLPLGIQAIINMIQLGSVSASWVLLIGLVLVGIVFSGVLQFVQLRITETLQQKIFVRSSFEFAYRIPRFETHLMTDTYAPELMNRFFDTMTLQKGIPKLLIDFSAAILQLLFGLILLSFYHSFFILFSLLLLLLLVSALYVTGKRGVKTAIQESKYKYKVAFWLEELARTMQTFKLIGQSDLPLHRTNEYVEGYLKSRESHFRVLLKQFIQLTSFKVLIAFCMLVFGGILVINNQINIGQFVASEIIILLIISSVEKIISGLEVLYDVYAAVDKIGHVMDIPIEEVSKPNAQRPSKGPLKVEVKNLSYSYNTNSKFQIHNLSLTIEKGQHTVFIGEDGSGKTTLLNLLGLTYPIDHGSIIFNDIPLNDLDMEYMRTIVSDYVPEQELFSGTIEENITMGRNGISFQDVLTACEKTNLLEDVKMLPDGFSTQILPDRRGFSKSMTEKIMMARCIVNQPNLFLLDDQQRIASGGDHESDYLKDLLINNNASWTLIAATKNELWLPYFEQVVKLEKGKIVFAGTFEEYKNWRKNA
jgi:ABC-type bacteriocin/lantibiotic exporter with double-glycine peptidase domain